jgi:hypothetical protein
MLGSVKPLIVHVGGRDVEVWIKYSARALRVRLAIQPGPRVVMTLPEATHASTAMRFLEEHSDWLLHALGKARTTQTSVIGHFAKFPSLTYDDKWLSVEILTAGRCSYTVRDAEDVIVLVHTEAHPEESLMRALRRVAQDGLEKAVHRIAKKVGVKIGAVSIRNQSTRWGSCSSSGALSLNWRLILLPPAMHDHVILHELAHRIHMNHSERFWSQLEAWDPEWKRHDQELTKKWNVLMDLGR